jgi:predicted NAD/FAD-binding protein
MQKLTVIAAHFTAFLKALQVRTTLTDMSFGASHDDGSFEWSSVSFASFVGSFWNFFRLSWWRLMFDIIRFNLFATDIVYESRQAGRSAPYGSMPVKAGHTQKLPRLESIGEYVQRKGYSEQFLKQYLVPMVASPWCIDPDSFSQEFPAAFLIKFM